MLCDHVPLHGKVKRSGVNKTKLSGINAQIINRCLGAWVPRPQTMTFSCILSDRIHYLLPSSLLFSPSVNSYTPPIKPWLYPKRLEPERKPHTLALQEDGSPSGWYGPFPSHVFFSCMPSGGGRRIQEVWIHALLLDRVAILQAYLTEKC